MSTLTKKGQVTIPKPFRDKLRIKEGDTLLFELKEGQLVLKKKKRRSLLDLGGIAKGRSKGKGDERAFVKKAVAGRIAKEGLPHE